MISNESKVQNIINLILIEQKRASRALKGIQNELVRHNQVNSDGNQIRISDREALRWNEIRASAEERVKFWDETLDFAKEKLQYEGL